MLCSIVIVYGIVDLAAGLDFVYLSNPLRDLQITMHHTKGINECHARLFVARNTEKMFVNSKTLKGDHLMKNMNRIGTQQEP